jgi:high affinity sulfate transporter 1
MKFFGGVLPVGRKAALRDALAGVTLAATGIPQVLGYTRIAGTPVVTGLYSILLPLLVYVTLGSSRHLVVAADSATAAILSSSVANMATPASDKYMALVAMVTLLTAVFLLAARIFKLGFLADFLSRTVLVGFLAGVGIRVCGAMLAAMLGVTTVSHETLEQMQEITARIHEVHLPTLALSVGAVASILIGRRLIPQVPIALFVVIATIAASAAFGFEHRGIAVIGPVSSALPSLHLPRVTWRETLALLPVAASCFAMIMAQSIATTRVFAVRFGERVDQNADILGLSAANAAAALTGAFVVNGSPLQTTAAERAGARSQIAQLVFGGCALLVLLTLTGPLQYLPHCVLTSIVFTVAMRMVDVRALREIRRESPGEFNLAVGTAIAVVAIGLEQGILLAMGLSLLRHVRHSYRPHSTVLASIASGHRESVPAVPGIQTEAGLIVYRFGADLFYANDTTFTEEVRALVKQAPTPVNWFVVDASAITDLDYSAARSLRDLCDELSEHGVTIVFGRVNQYLRADMDRHGITAAVGETHIFPTLHEALAAVRTAGAIKEG